MEILIPTDFSANALNYGVLLGKAIKANLILLHVYTSPITRENLAYPLITEEKDMMLSETTEKLHKADGLSRQRSILTFKNCK